ncbi:MAG TPA: Yip1 family protein, partial [Stellaceae bacterium]|nr:Yip1 family protein [Stellaceae bacterium]
ADEVAGTREGLPMELVSRARGIVKTPRSEWPVIADEPADIGRLYADYVAILAAVPMFAELVRFLVAGVPAGAAIGIAVTGYVMALANVAIIAYVSTKLAPAFGGVDDREAAFKLAAFGYTAAWLGGVFLLLPAIGWLLQLVCGVYSMYVYYLGIGELLRVPRERRVGFFVIVLVLTVIIAMVIAVLLGMLTGYSRMSMMMLR